MEKRIKRLTAWWLLLVVVGTAGIAYESYRIAQIRQFNQALQSGKPVTDDRYAYTAKFAAAYQLGGSHDFKHAVQSYSQLLEASPSTAQQARIQYNIGNNLFMSALNRRVNDNGSLTPLAATSQAYHLASEVSFVLRMPRFFSSAACIVSRYDAW